MEIIQFIIANIDLIGERELEHLSIISVAVGFVIVTGVPIGIAITQNEQAINTILYIGAPAKTSKMCMDEK